MESLWKKTSRISHFYQCTTNGNDADQVRLNMLRMFRSQLQMPEGTQRLWCSPPPPSHTNTLEPVKRRTRARVTIPFQAFWEKNPRLKQASLCCLFRSNILFQNRKRTRQNPLFAFHLSKSFPLLSWTFPSSEQATKKRTNNVLGVQAANLCSGVHRNVRSRGNRGFSPVPGLLGSMPTALVKTGGD